MRWLVRHPFPPSLPIINTHPPTRTGLTHEIDRQKPLHPTHIIITQLRDLPVSTQNLHLCPLLPHQPPHLLQLHTPTLRTVPLPEGIQAPQDRTQPHGRRVMLREGTGGAPVIEVAAEGVADDVGVAGDPGVRVREVGAEGRGDEVDDAVEAAPDIAAAAVPGALAVQGVQVDGGGCGWRWDGGRWRGGGGRTSAGCGGSSRAGLHHRVHRRCCAGGRLNRAGVGLSQGSNSTESGTAIQGDASGRSPDIGCTGEGGGGDGHSRAGKGGQGDELE